MLRGRLQSQPAVVRTQRRKEPTEAVGKVTGPLRIITSLLRGLVWLFFKLFHPSGVWSVLKNWSRILI